MKTPAFDRVAAQGLLFTHAFTPTGKCAPSRSAILTGRNPWQLKAAANHWCYFPPEFKTYPEALAEHGYWVGMTGKGWAPGVATNILGKLRKMAGQPFNRRTATPPTSQISGTDYAANFQDFLDAAPKNQPWCFWYGCHEPHRGYEYGSGVAKGGKKLSDIPRVPGVWPDNEVVRNDLLDYAFEVEHFDHHLNRMLALLEKRGLLDNTIIVVTSDNGMPFPHDKGQAYLDSNHLPLAIMWKKGIAKPGRVVDDYMSFVDLAPTVIELAGVRWDETGMAETVGHNLTDLFVGATNQSRPSWRNHVLIGRERNDVGRPNDEGYPIRGIIMDDQLYLRNFDPIRWPAGDPKTGYLDVDGGPTKTEVLKAHRLGGQQSFYWNASFGKRGPEEFYDLKRDPDCLTNLFGVAKFQPVAVRFREQLFRELTVQKDPRVLGQGHIFDEYPFANPDIRGFYERYARGEKMDSSWVNPSDFEADTAD